MKVEVRISVVPELEPGVQPPLQETESEGVDLAFLLELSLVDESDRGHPVFSERSKQILCDPIHLLIVVPARLGDREIIDGDRHPTRCRLWLIGPKIAGCGDGSHGAEENETTGQFHPAILARNLVVRVPL
jgi:hypothetical protein